MLSVRFYACFIVLLMFPLVAQASEDRPLEASNVAAFLGAEKQLLPLAEKMEQDGVKSFFKPRAMRMTAKGIPSYARNVADLKANYPQYYKEMSDVLRLYKPEEGDVPYFSNPEQWAENSDRVMLAFYAANGDATETGYLEMKQKLNPAMMAMLPPESKAMLAPVLDMMKSLQNVSDHDKSVVMAFEDQIGVHLLVTQ